jgi:hypothetical protein
MKGWFCWALVWGIWSLLCSNCCVCIYRPYYSYIVLKHSVTRILSSLRAKALRTTFAHSSLRSSLLVVHHLYMYSSRCSSYMYCIRLVVLKHSMYWSHYRARIVSTKVSSVYSYFVLVYCSCCALTVFVLSLRSLSLRTDVLDTS